MNFEADVDDFFNEDTADNNIEEGVSAPSSPVVEVKETQNNNGPTLLAELPSSSYGAFIKILSTLTTGSDSVMGKVTLINIVNGFINVETGSGYITCNLQEIIENLNFTIGNPIQSIKKMKLIKGGDKTVFINDNNSYIISNMENDMPSQTVNLSKPMDNFHATFSAPTLNDDDIVYKFDGDNGILLENIAALKAAKTLYESLHYVIHMHKETHELISISTEEDGYNYNFTSVIPHEDDIIKYRMVEPFIISKPDEIEIIFYKNNDNRLWIKTISTFGLAEVQYMERLSVVQNIKGYSDFKL